MISILVGNHRLIWIEENSISGFEAALKVAKDTGKTGLVKSLFDSMVFKIPGCGLCHKPVRQNEVFCIAEVFDTVFLVHVECVEKYNEADAEAGGKIDLAAALTGLANDAIDS